MIKINMTNVKGVYAERYRKMNGNQGKNTREEQLGMVWSLIRQDAVLRNSIYNSVWYDEGRLELLCQIIQRLVLREMEGLENQIYSYGSMIQEEDLAARQVFLWLLRMIKEMPQEEKG